jgi:ankyrin repeat protein
VSQSIESPHRPPFQYPPVQPNRDPDDLDRKGERKWSGLYLACESGHARIARLFLEAGADPTLADTHGMTPLDIARESSNWRCARLLEVRRGMGGLAALFFSS